MLRLKSLSSAPCGGFPFHDPKTGFRCHSWSFNAAVAAWYSECQKRKRPITWDEASEQVEKYVCEQLIKAPNWDTWVRFEEREPHNFFEQNASAIICVYKPDIEKLNKCLTAVFPQVKEVILVADGRLPSGMVEHKKIKPLTIYSESGYAKKANLGARHATTDYLWFINDDCYPLPDCAERLMEVTTLNPKIGMVGHLLEYPDGQIQHGGTVRSPDGIGFSHIKDARIKDMTNIIAILTILTVTNWESVGTLTDKKGQQFDVVEGVRCTNWTATFEFEGRQIGFVLKSVRGDKCDEVRNLIPPAINQWLTNTLWTNIFYYSPNIVSNQPMRITNWSSPFFKDAGGSTEILARTNRPTGNGITEWSCARTGCVQLSSNDVLNAVVDWPQIKHVEGTNIMSLPTPHDFLPRIQLPTNQDLSNRAFMEIPSIKSIQFATNQ